MAASRLSSSGDFTSLPRLGKDGRPGPADLDGDDGPDVPGDAGSEIKSAAARLEKWHKLTDVGHRLGRIDLTGCNITNHLAPAIAELYNRQKNNIRQVILSENPNLGADALKYLLVAFENSRTLQALNLRNTGLSDECISSVIKSLSVLPQLTEVNFAANALTELGMELFAAFLQTNTTLTALSFTANKLRDAGAQALAKALEVNTTLRSLELISCRIADAGAIHIGLMLAVNTTLTKLDMSRNPVTEDGVDAIAEVVQKNTTILQVTLTGVEKIYLERIAQVCRRNRSFVGELVPHKLDKEMQRLYVQKHKLEVANHQLKELHAETARIQEQVKNIDMEFDIEKQDINAKAKKVVEVMDFTTMTIQELQRKYKELQAQGLREKDAKEAEVEAANDKLDVVCREREQLEVRTEELQAQYQHMVDERQRKIDEIERKMEACRVDQAEYVSQRKATQEKIAEVMKQVQELERQRGLAPSTSA